MIELINVSYSAENEQGTKDIIKNVSLKLDGKLIAFTGPNGGGKSTLAKLIMGIIKPTSGKILLDKQELKDLLLFEVQYLFYHKLFLVLMRCSYDGAELDDQL